MTPYYPGPLCVAEVRCNYCLALIRELCEHMHVWGETQRTISVFLPQWTLFCVHNIHWKCRYSRIYFFQLEWGPQSFGNTFGGFENHCECSVSLHGCMRPYLFHISWKIQPCLCLPIFILIHMNLIYFDIIFTYTLKSCFSLLNETSCLYTISLTVYVVTVQLCPCCKYLINTAAVTDVASFAFIAYPHTVHLPNEP